MTYSYVKLDTKHNLINLMNKRVQNIEISNTYSNKEPSSHKWAQH